MKMNIRGINFKNSHKLLVSLLVGLFFSSLLLSSTAHCENHVFPQEFYVGEVTVEIGDVVRGQELPNSLPPTKSYNVSVTITPSLASTDHNIQFDIINGSADNGTATITANATRTTSGTITVTGGQQTKPGHAGQLKIRARFDGATEIAFSSGFSICAHPANFSTSLLSDINTATQVGVQVRNDWESDSGTRSDMDEAERSEVIGVNQRDDPPFTIGGGGLTSGYIPATVSSTVDTHTYPRAGITLGPAGTVTYDQLFMLKCSRCGAIDAACVKSGFKIVHEVKKIGENWVHTCTKSGAAITINNKSTAAGSGSANSGTHTLP